MERHLVNAIDAEMVRHCEAVGELIGAAKPTQMEAMLLHGEFPMLPLVLLAPDGSSVSVLIRERTDTSTTSAFALKSCELRLTTTGGPQPAKGDL